MADVVITQSDEGPVATVTISNPNRRNAVDQAATEAIADAFRELDADEAARCVILTGEGDAFCAGADLSSVGESPTAETIDRGFHAAARAIATCSKPVIARVRGPATGAGASLAIACDFVYAAESARIGFSFAKIGLTADTGATWFLPRLVGTQTAMELLSTGRLLEATEAEQLGLCTDVVPDADLDDFVEERSIELAAGPTRALASLRWLLLRANANSLEEHLELEAREQARMFHTHDAMEGAGAFAAGREPAFQGK